MKFSLLTTKITTALLLLICFTSHAEQFSVAVKLAKIEQKNISLHIIAYGVVEPETNSVINLSIAQSGLVNQLWVRIGQRVKQGDKLAEISTSPKARMQFLQAKSALNYATKQLARIQRMVKEQLALQTEVDIAKKNVFDSKTALNAIIKNNKNKSQEILTAPINGIITQLNISLGERIGSNSTILLIAPENRLVARVGIEPEDVNKLIPKTNVLLHSVFNSNISVKSQISNVHAMINPTTHLIDTLIPIPAANTSQFLLGTRIVAKFILPAQLSLVVPRHAVLSDEKGHYIFTIKNKIAHKIYITNELEQDNSVVISGPIKAKQNVVVLGNYVLEDGSTVREIN